MAAPRDFFRLNVGVIPARRFDAAARRAQQGLADDLELELRVVGDAARLLLLDHHALDASTAGPASASEMPDATMGDWGHNEDGRLTRPCKRMPPPSSLQ